MNENHPKRSSNTNDYKGPLIYMDHNATTPIDPAAIAVMTAYMKDEYGNPSSAYELGVRAKGCVEQAREEVALLINCKSSNFTN